MVTSASGLRVRRVGSLVLVVAATVALVGAVLTGYASRALFDSDQLSNRATSALEDAAVREAIATKVTDDVVIAAERDLIGLRPLIQGIAGQVVGSGAFRSLFHRAVRDLHRAVFDRDQNTALLTIADVGAVIKEALERVQPRAAERIPAAADARIVREDPPQVVVDLARAADRVRAAAVWLAVLAALLAAGALVVSPDRRRTVAQGGLSVALAGLVARDDRARPPDRVPGGEPSGRGDLVPPRIRGRPGDSLHLQERRRAHRRRAAGGQLPAQPGPPERRPVPGQPLGQHQPRGRAQQRPEGQPAGGPAAPGAAVRT
jgi:hypothetical protein